MRHDRGTILLLAQGGMELSWSYAWAAFMMTSLSDRSFPLPEAIGTFVLAAALSLGVRGLGLRVISVLGIQILGVLLAASRIVHTFLYRAYPYFGKAWVTDFVQRTRDPMEWLILILLLFFALSFWLGGATLAWRSRTYLTICSRFDLGVAAFFLLFFVTLLLRVKGGIEPGDPTPELMLFPFFIFSLLAIGWARSGSGAQRDFLEGNQGVGVFLSFTVVVLALGSGAVLLFLPYLRVAAEAGYGVLKSAGAPLGPVIARVLLLLFMGVRLRQDAAPSSPDRNAQEVLSSGEPSRWDELVQEVLRWGLLGLGVLIGFALLALATLYLLRWLFSRTSRDRGNPIHWQRAVLWIQRLWATLGMGLQRAAKRLKGSRGAAELFHALLNWGRRSGLPRLVSETPTEYGSRLLKRFPSLSGEIGGIVEAFNLVVYGELALSEGQMSRAKVSWKKLRSPRHWPVRVKSWFRAQRWE